MSTVRARRVAGIGIRSTFHRSGIWKGSGNFGSNTLKEWIMRKRPSKPKLKVIQCVTGDRVHKQVFLNAERDTLARGDTYVSYDFTTAGFSGEDIKKLNSFSEVTGGRFIDQDGVWLDFHSITDDSIGEALEFHIGDIREFTGIKVGSVAGMTYLQFTDLVFVEEGVIQNTSYVDFGRFRLIILDVIDKYIRPPLVLVKG
jgi:hypothetical protein